MKAMSALLAALGLFAAAFAGARDWASFVDPMVGTEGTGSEYGGMMPMTGVPFGWNKREQVCIASRGKVKKLCMEVKAGTSADASIRALRGSGGLESP